MHMGLKVIRDLATHTFDNNLCALLKLYISLYADDTVLLAESPKALQNSINLKEEYCHLWKQKIMCQNQRLLFCREVKLEADLNFILKKISWM